MDDKVQNRPVGGVIRRERPTTSTKTSHRTAAGSGFLCFTCGVCLILSLICVCLATLVVLLDQKVEAVSYRHGFRTLKSLTTMNEESRLHNINFRLPKEVKPIHYDIYLFPNLRTGTFTGKVTILIDVLERRSYIALHQKDLNITSHSLKTFDCEENYEVEVEPIVEIPKYEILVVPTKQELNPGLYNLSFEFTGDLQPNKIVGFYSSKYKDAENKTRYIATTKFEPTYARRAYPCFDEPSFKAEFSVKLVHPTTECYNALSNMNIESTEVDKPKHGFTTVTFAKSVPMSTYVSCFIVSDFIGVTKLAKGLAGKEFPISIYTTKEQKSKGTFALDVGVKAIEYYIKLFNIDYPLPKLDMAAIPDFVSGAMENWGLVTYRQSRLLYSKNITSTTNMYDIVTVVCHEFAHMWFGNLVTMKWWNDLWLNEGFASFMQYKCANAIFPDWGFMNEFLTDQIQFVLVTDAKLSTHPIVQTVTHPDEITAIFDEISYKKGAAVIRMMENFIGPEIFYAGITVYLNKYAYQNAETADLFSILQDAVGNRINITAIMDTWTKQKGFPVVTVRRSGDTCILTQKRFLADPEASATTDVNEYKWTIPITYVTDKNSTPTLVWFEADAKHLEIELKEPVEWVKFNHDQTGYYRVNYDLQEWATLGSLLRTNHERLSVADRTHILDDAFSLASASEIDYSVALNLTPYLRAEQKAAPWLVAAQKLLTIDTLLSSTDLSQRYKAYVRSLMNGIYNEGFWTHINENVDLTDRKFRVTIIEVACLVSHEQCIADAGKYFKAWLHDRGTYFLHPDIRSLVYYYGMYEVGKEADWDILYQTFLAETDASQKLKLMRGLSAIQSPAVIMKFISLAMDENNVRGQDFLQCLITISTNPVGTPIVWDWVRQNWEFLVDRYTLNDRYLGQLIPSITKSFSTTTKLNEMKAFFEKYPEAGAGATSRAKALETVSNNIKWLAKHTKELGVWLDNAPTFD